MAVGVVGDGVAEAFGRNGEGESSARSVGCGQSDIRCLGVISQRAAGCRDFVIVVEEDIAAGRRAAAVGECHACSRIDVIGGRAAPLEGCVGVVAAGVGDAFEF